MLKVEEVYEKQVRITKERPDGSEYVNFDKAYDTRDCLLNKDYIVCVQPYEFTSSLAVGRVAEDFPEGTKFSKFILDGNSFRSSEIVVVGSFQKFCRLLQENKS